MTSCPSSIYILAYDKGNFYPTLLTSTTPENEGGCTFSGSYNSSLPSVTYEGIGQLTCSTSNSTLICSTTSTKPFKDDSQNSNINLGSSFCQSFSIPTSSTWVMNWSIPESLQSKGYNKNLSPNPSYDRGMTFYQICYGN